MLHIVICQSCVAVALLILMREVNIIFKSTAKDSPPRLFAVQEVDGGRKEASLAAKCPRSRQEGRAGSPLSISHHGCGLEEPKGYLRRQAHASQPLFSWLTSLPTPPSYTVCYDSCSI